ncbi:HemK family protein methyltransferase [Pseudomonas aeruginosa]
MSESRLLTLRDYIRWAVSRFHAAGLFFGHGTDNAWDEARHLVLGSLHLPWEISDSYLDCRLEDDERAELAEILRRRIEERIPAAYLLGEAWFCGIPFSVDERVLVPRSPIAELIEQRFAPWLPAEPARILDLCTGSGCIGIACAYAFEQAEVVLAEAADHLSEKGLLIVEVGNSEVHVQALYPEVDFTWLEFEHGGHGVFMLSAAQCREHRELFRSRLEK